ncbi:MAG: DUF4245 family protein [Candidatus Microbacterium phytovorans]|uniref:DUF4245 family protein n=1 Tax=Candidatus Microbacterium phytovorans TaxID=3121374 RepID=A0AAJ5W3W7_9MICO|nr:DUF4245 family protein [Microbacterium sp.]WEK14738.1 MAG: DUF4245 family protein [Microbacterium sp.]
MASGPRIVAELGRPETPDETAARKAESSRVYRSSQTFRNLIAALIVTVAVVAVVYFGVPRGNPPAPEPVDVAAAASVVASERDRPVVEPEVPASWRANAARVEDGAWTVVYAPPKGFVRIAQGFDAAEDWPTTLLGGYAPTGTTTVDGITWDVYDLPGDAGIRYALVTDAGADTVAVYGSMSAETAETAAAGLADQIRTLREETP